MITGSIGDGGTETTFGGTYCPDWRDRASDSGIVVTVKEDVGPLLLVLLGGV
jgi:hypothetical protein